MYDITAESRPLLQYSGSAVVAFTVLPLRSLLGNVLGVRPAPEGADMWG
jgi:hypothetical protein